MQTHLTSDFMASQGFPTNLPSRFFKHIQITESCWNWIGYKQAIGYGRIFIRWDGPKIKMMLVHRVSWILHFGSIPEGLDVCHDCPDGDNRACCNPAYLWLGTHQENMDDRGNKGRNIAPSGEKNVNSKLTWDIVSEIRRVYIPRKVTFEELGKRFGVDMTCIAKVIYNESWKEEKRPVKLGQLSLLQLSRRDAQH